MNNVLFVIVLFIIVVSGADVKRVNVLSDEFNNTIEVFVPRVFKACPVIPAAPETDSVHNLRPGNIRVIASMGDSVTAGMSAKDTILLLTEYRGLAFSIGGDSGITTIPNLLKTYTPTGYPIGVSTGTGSDRARAGNGFNAAVSGAININMLAQAMWLHETLLKTTSVNFEKDWKLLTVFIGSNNLCDVCNTPVGNDAADYQVRVIEAIDYIRKNIPRVFVNLVSNLDVSGFYTFRSGICLLTGVACPCGGSSDAAKRNLVAVATRAYQETSHKIAAHYRNNNDTEFALIVQPYLTSSVIPDRSYLATSDCFHPSAKGQEALAIGLWNNMISPASKKKSFWDVTETPLCATEETLLYTS